VAAAFLLNVALNKAQNISVAPGFCERVRFRKSNCQKCLEICPQRAISLDPGPTINNDCNDCGLCQNVCPTEVFHNELYTDQYLLNQAIGFFSRDRQQTPAEKKILSINCHRAENQNKNSLPLPCLGRMTANIILGVAFSGVDGVVLIKGNCSQCRFQQGEKLLKNSIRASRILLQSVGLGRFGISIKEKAKKQKAMLTRREIFLKISNKVKSKTASFIHCKEKTIRKKLTGNPESKNGKRLSPGRELLRQLLKQKMLETTMVVKYKPAFPWGKIKIEENNCSACGTCLAVCPTGAILKKTKNEQQFFYFNSSLCNNCSLCMAVCPENAVDFEENFALVDILEEQAIVVARIKLASCMICGETITTKRTKLCSTCQKRQVRPVHVKV
jgi:ferredoxin